MTHKVRALLTSLIALAVLAGCSADTESDAGPQAIEIQDADLVFELPAAWVELDPAEAREALTDDDLMAELVGRHGPDTKGFGPVEIFISTTGVPPPGSGPVFVASAKGIENGVLPQMTVKLLPLDELPSVTELEHHHRKNPLGIDYLDLTEIDTGLGSAVLAGFSTRAREPVLHWAELTVDTGSDVMTISIVTDDRARSEQLAADIADSLERTS